MSVKTGRGDKKTAPKKSKSDKYLESRMPAAKARKGIIGAGKSRNA